VRNLLLLVLTSRLKLQTWAREISEMGAIGLLIFIVIPHPVRTFGLVRSVRSALRDEGVFLAEWYITMLRIA